MADTNINDAFILEPLRVNTPLAVALRYKDPLYEFTRA